MVKYFYYIMVKFGADSFTIQGDTECDRQTDGRTDRHTLGDSNYSSAGLRPVELMRNKNRKQERGTYMYTTAKNKQS